MKILKHIKKHSKYDSVSSWNRKKIPVHRTYETIPDHPQLKRRKGDIFQFSCGYFKHNFNDWKDWFLTEEEKIKYWKRDRRIPNYAINEFGIIVNRYKCAKVKKYVIGSSTTYTYTDYGSMFMLITGSRMTHIRKYYGVHPMTLTSKFPHIQKDGNIYVNIKKPFSVINKEWFLYKFNLSKFIKNILKKYGDCEKSRDIFIMKLNEIMENPI